jgi:hypothetical protein
MSRGLPYPIEAAASFDNKHQTQIGVKGKTVVTYLNG